MKKRLSILPALVLLPFLHPLLAAELKIHLEVDGQPGPVISLNIQGDTATTRVNSETEQFNLKEMSWMHPDTANWISLTQSEFMAEQSRAKALLTLKTNDALSLNIREFLNWALDPAFTISKTNDILRLTSGQVDYLIQGRVTTTNSTDKFFRYAVLNAYKKSITERKLPPYSELKAIEEMKKLGHIPRSVSITMPGIPNAPSFKMEIIAPDANDSP